jgi:chromosomal replication initiation ATPase DnaA
VKCKYGICSGDGFIIKEADNGEMVAAPCQCRIERDKVSKFDAHVIAAKIPRAFLLTAETSLTAYKSIPFDRVVSNHNAPQISLLESIIVNPLDFFKKTQMLWIWGKDDNSGHSSFAVMVGVALIKSGVKLRFISMQELLNAFTSFDSKTEFFNDLDSHNYFIIDDAFDVTRSHASGEYTKVHLFNWLNTSINNNKKFICTSNVAPGMVDVTYANCRAVLARTAFPVEIRGNIILAKNK